MRLPSPRSWLFLSTVLILLSVPLMTRSAAQAPPGYGPEPRLAEPRQGWLPTIKWSVANEPWPKGATPKAAQGLAVQAFAQGLKHPRWLHVLPNGDVLVAESATEPASSWSPRSMFQNLGAAQVRCDCRERQPHFPAARRGRRRHRRAAFRVPRRAASAVRHGADRRSALRRQYRQRRTLSLPHGRHTHHRQGHQAARPARRPPLDPDVAGEPRTVRSSM